MDLRPLYDVLDRDIADLNIEGATVSGRHLLLFQRGNGRGAVNAVVTLNDALLDSLGDGRIEAGAVTAIGRDDLGEVDGVGRVARMRPACETAVCCSPRLPRAARTPTTTASA